MRNIIYTIISLLIFAACEDYLNRPPLDQISNDAYWKTASDLEKYAVRFYTIFPVYKTAGQSGEFIADAKYGSDDAIIASVNTTLNGARPVVNGAGGTNWSWSEIRSINIFFDNYGKCNDPFESWSQYLGEAHFFRAYLYFEKVLSFGDVPWYNTELKMDSEDLYKERTSRTVVVDSILQDLDRAFSLLKPLKDVDGGNNRLSKEAALLFKSRVALFEGTWQKYHAGTPFATDNADPEKYFRIAVEAAEELMSGKYNVGIYGSTADDYGIMFGSDDLSGNKEVILWKDYDKSIGVSHNSQVYCTARTEGRSATFEFVQSFLSNQGEPIDYYAVAAEKKGTDFLTYIGNNADPRLRKTIWIPGDIMWDNENGYKTFDLPYIGKSGEFLNTTGFQIKKGVDVKSLGAGGVTGNDCETGAIVFRYAEVLLNYAEAKYELDGNVDYGKSINLLRKRVGMPDFQVVEDPNRNRFSDYGYAVSNELFEIRRERRVELGAEGFRNTDYKRWRAHKLFQGKRPLGYPVLKEEFAKGTKFPPVNSDGLLDPFQKELPDGYKFNENRDYLECIPTNEITLNPNLKPNPGWQL